ncbi:helix-turn-helix domain-containing protein [Stygiolobus caldivivus]|uniref:TrmB family transcriptional regulator n=1 Tax=Stygiolobus caldivivus TaxID=2824673 RepID=A0A8D5U825_9CREN|nr:helix-turn-helix domain-containing protein [Stygiolobus caldivivus]BCU71073.1 TrmB family transcriptional regulator [Stygiolobus caldivivus]
MTSKVKFPDGREVDIHEVISFMYGLGMGEIEVLHKLLTRGQKYSADQLSEELKVSKASVNKALNTLLSKGLIEREKIIEDGKKGRPVYIYWANKELVTKKISQDFYKLIVNTRDTLKKTISENKKIMLQVT